MEKLVKKQMRFFIGSVLFTIFAALAAVFVQFLKGEVLDFALDRNSNQAFIYGGFLLFMIASETACYYLYDYFRGRYSVENARELRRRYFETLLKKSPPQIADRKHGDIVAEYTNQIDLVVGEYLGSLPILVEISFKAIVVSISLIILDYRVAVLTILLLTTPLYVPKLIEKRLQRAQNSNVQAFQSHLGKVVEWLSGFEIIKNFSIEKVIQCKFEASNDEISNKAFAFRKMTYISKTVSAILSYMSHFIVLAFAAYLVFKGDFSAGQFFIAISMIDQLSYPIIAVSVLLQDRLGAKPTAEKLVKILEYVPERGGQNKNIQEIHDIKFSHVGFEYNENQPVLKDFDLSIANSDKCLIMGPSGSGKSTIMNLLMGYYEPKGGTVRINDISIHDIENLNQLVAIMRQEPVLFNDTLRNNLTMYQEIADEKLIEILKQLNLNKFASLDGLNTLISENGTNLSGGERKRINLARTLICEAPIVILDEPLANVDQETVEKIEDVIMRLDQGMLFVITHQFSEDKKTAFSKFVEL